MVAQDTNQREKDQIYMLLGDVRQVKGKSGVQDEIFFSSLLGCFSWLLGQAIGLRLCA